MFGWLFGNSSASDDEVTQRVISDDKNGTYEFVAGQQDYEAVLGDTDHTVLDEEPYEPERGFFSRLIFGG